MMGNGLANIVAAAIVALAILWTGGFDRSSPAGQADTVSKEELADIYARAVGDIRNDIVVNCGCCGENEALPRKASADSF